MPSNSFSPNHQGVRLVSARLLVAAVVTLCAFGCQQKKIPTADPNRAESALRQVLDTWKVGQTPDSLAAQSEPIHVSDSEWQGGTQLLDYEITAGQTAGFGWRCDVMLTVKSSGGSPHKHMALYRIDTEPTIVVVHEE
jgi:hypothetical protein